MSMKFQTATASVAGGTARSQAVTLRFKYTEAEYVAAVRQYFDPFRAKFTAVFGVLLLALGVFASLVSEDSIAPWFLIIAGLLALGMFYLNYYAAPRRWFRRAARPREEYTLHYSDAGIVFHAKDIDSTLQWSLYQAVCETEQFYFLIYGKDMFSVIPKRAFTSAEQEQAFRDLLRRHVDPQVTAAQLSDCAQGQVEEYVPKSLEPPDWR